MKRFHRAISTDDLDPSVAKSEYSRRLDCDPEFEVMPDEYALWRCGVLNLSGRADLAFSPGTLRHLGWEDPATSAFSHDTNTNGIRWEVFIAAQQTSEIQQQWTEAEGHQPNDKRDE